MTAALTRVISHIPTDKYTGLITYEKKIDMLQLHILPTLKLGRHRIFERLLIVLGYLTVTIGSK